jgi:hypothetical protein
MSVTATHMSDLMRRIRPWACSSPLVRVGAEFDGGYLVPDLIFRCDALLSIGIGWDVSFDLALAERGATVLQFDHTLEAGYLPGGVDHPNFRLQRLGLGTITHGDLLSLDDMVQQIDSLTPAHPSLNFDIEGAEWSTITAAHTEQLSKFEVIACELHDLHRLGEPEFFASVVQTITALTTHHRSVHVHPNNNRPAITIAGVDIPEVLEVSFLRADLATFTPIDQLELPHPLDTSNNPYLPDLSITFEGTP